MSIAESGAQNKTTIDWKNPPFLLVIKNIFSDDDYAQCLLTRRSGQQENDPALGMRAEGATRLQVCAT